MSTMSKCNKKKNRKNRDRVSLIYQMQMRCYKIKIQLNLMITSVSTVKQSNQLFAKRICYAQYLVFIIIIINDCVIIIQKRHVFSYTDRYGVSQQQLCYQILFIKNKYFRQRTMFIFESQSK